ncbi:hypothetical protein [Chryseobacterium sp. HMWF035]|uniref:hypothetical protein n=1 Tax=Chryseobacterium sp. HMWF035 TaxID=2056868 RepID=UPI000D5785AB|nr:hypothetical protein [Chryseobacterium sp. HMWF035]PVV50456.1 hypothetical protein DD829_22615 [Chryseobacterium sp. HMWF035]
MNFFHQRKIEEDKIKFSYFCFNTPFHEEADYNPFVVKRLLSKRTPSHQDDYYEPRKYSEAVYYACEARLIWHKTPKILEWLKEQLINK